MNPLPFLKEVYTLPVTVGGHVNREVRNLGNNINKVTPINHTTDELTLELLMLADRQERSLLAQAASLARIHLLQHSQHAVFDRRRFVRSRLGYRSRLRAVVRARFPVVVLAHGRSHRGASHIRQRLQSLLVKRHHFSASCNVVAHVFLRDQVLQQRTPGGSAHVFIEAWLLEVLVDLSHSSARPSLRTNRQVIFSCDRLKD